MTAADARELAGLRAERERLAMPPLRPVGDWRGKRASTVAVLDRHIARYEQADAEASRPRPRMEGMRQSRGS